MASVFVSPDSSEEVTSTEQDDPSSDNSDTETVVVDHQHRRQQRPEHSLCQSKSLFTPENQPCLAISTYPSLPPTFWYPESAFRYSGTTPLLAPQPHLPPADPATIPIPNIESPAHFQYRELLAQERAFETDKVKLIQELRGERVVPVHGVGIWACSAYSNPSIEQLKQDVWKQYGSWNSWLASAKARSSYYATPGVVRPPLRWTLVEDGFIPNDALQTGTESSGQRLYSTRVWFKGGLHLGKAAHHLQGTSTVSYGSMEHSVNVYEILIGDDAYAHWVAIPRFAALSFESIPELQGVTPIDGGREADGTSLFIAQGEFEQGWHPGKAALNDGHCCLGYGGGECWVRPFRILAWNTDDL